MLSTTAGYAFIVLLKDRDDAVGLSRLLTDVRLDNAQTASLFLVPPAAGIEFFADESKAASLDEWWAKNVPRDYVPVYLLMHEPDLKDWIGELDGEIYVGLPGSFSANGSKNEDNQDANLYTLESNIKTFTVNGPLDFATAVMRDFCGNPSPDNKHDAGVAAPILFDEDEALRMAALSGDFPMPSTSSSQNDQDDKEDDDYMGPPSSLDWDVRDIPPRPRTSFPPPAPMTSSSGRGMRGAGGRSSASRSSSPPAAKLPPPVPTTPHPFDLLGEAGSTPTSSPAPVSPPPPQNRGAPPSSPSRSQPPSNYPPDDQPLTAADVPQWPQASGTDTSSNNANNNGASVNNQSGDTNQSNQSGSSGGSELVLSPQAGESGDNLASIPSWPQVAGDSNQQKYPTVPLASSTASSTLPSGVKSPPWAPQPTPWLPSKTDTTRGSRNAVAKRGLPQLPSLKWLRRSPINRDFVETPNRDLARMMVQRGPTIIVMGSRKGGVGKTSYAAGVSIVAGTVLDAVGHKACIVDANIANPDAWGQMNLGEGAATVREVVAALTTNQEPPPPIYATTPALACYPEARQASEYSKTDIRRFADYLRRRYSFIVVDMSNRLPDPLAGPEAAVAAYWLEQADALVLPTTSSKQDFTGVLDYLDVRDLPPTVVPYIVPQQKKNRQHPVTQQYLNVIRQRVQHIVEIPDQADDVRYAGMEGLPVEQVSPELRVAYRELTELLIRVPSRARA